MQLIVRSLTTHVLDVSPDANVEVKCFLFPCSKKNLQCSDIFDQFETVCGSKLKLSESGSKNVLTLILML